MSKIVVKCSESLSNRVSNIIRGYIDHVNFAAVMAFWFIIFLHVLLVLFYHCVYGCMFCILLFNSVSYVYYCYVRSVLYILFSLCQLTLFGYPN